VSRPELSAEEILAVLNRHHVDYLVIGAFAAITQGVPLEATHEVDVTTGGTPTTSAGLSAALPPMTGIQCPFGALVSFSCCAGALACQRNSAPPTLRIVRSV